MVLEDRDVLFSCLVFIYFQLQWVFGAVRGLSPVAEHGRWVSQASVAVTHRLSICGFRAQAQQPWLPGSRAQAQQLWAPCPIETTDSGISSLVIFEQPLNALYPMFVTPKGISIFERFLHPENIYSIVSTFDVSTPTKEKEVSEVQFPKA